jgi:hypothetical protein
MHVTGLSRSIPSHDTAIEKIYSIWRNYPPSRRDEGIPIQEIIRDHGLSQDTTHAAFSILSDEGELRVVRRNESEYLCSDKK